MAAVVVALIVLVGYGIDRYGELVRVETRRRAKLERLAADNAWDLRFRGDPPHLPGCLFTTQFVRADVSDQFSTFAPGPVLFGNYDPVSRGGNHPQSGVAPSPVKSWGFLAIQLDRRLPHLLLVSRTRRPGDLTLPIVPRADEALSLEGNFDDYFRLYCPAGFQQEALEVITPDVMALLIDKATPFDVEIADDWMLFYSRIPFDLLDPSLYRRLFDIVRTIGGKVERT